MTGQYLDIALHNTLKPGVEATDMIPPGLNLVRNDTGRPEPVLTGRQWDVLTSAVRDRGRPTIQIQRLTITAEEAKRLTVDDVARMIHAELDTLEEMVL